MHPFAGWLQRAKKQWGPRTQGQGALGQHCPLWALPRAQTLGCLVRGGPSDLYYKAPGLLMVQPP